MVQLILVYVIVFGAVIYAAYRMYLTIKNILEDSVCNGCNLCTAKQELMQLIGENKNRS